MVCSKCGGVMQWDRTDKAMACLMCGRRVYSKVGESDTRAPEPARSNASAPEVLPVAQPAKPVLVEAVEVINQLTEVQTALNRLMAQAVNEFTAAHNEAQAQKVVTTDPWEIYMDTMIEAMTPQTLSALLGAWMQGLNAMKDHAARDAAASALLAFKTYLDRVIAAEPPHDG